MLFDPRSFVPALDAGQPGWAPAQQHSVAGRRPAHDFLTLPAVSASIPASGILTFGDERDINDLVIAQFRAGVIDAKHVSNPAGVGDAFAQAFYGWLAPRVPTTKVLSFDFALIDHQAVESEISEFGFDMQETSALYLGIRLEEETVYTVTEERAAAMRALHPSLVFMTFQLIRAATARSLHLRTPDDLLDMFARWHWEFEPLTDDDEAREVLKERYGGDDPDIDRYLPSVVRPLLAPDETLPRWQWAQSDRNLSLLSRRKLRELARLGASDWRGSLCTALADLDLAISRMGKATLLHNAQWAEPAYSAATIAYAETDYVGEVLDDHFECANNSGSATLFQCFIPLAGKTATIQAQYAVLDDTLKLIAVLDRVLEHFS
ncbi:PRTRC system protein F [Cupriavidus agavae]|uniref:PRTRC genetic system protein F n=1 Tax=Cupriavidus agavae TaxID=1001822 RepID=A0A4Q7RAA3_9BURK|nr:PRTRC system protein F [Cupriavidus agavae]RZT29088.1 PRTRC genetic system protein F [Cupriavidus agavae]